MEYGRLIIVSFTATGSACVNGMPIQWTTGDGGNGNFYEVVDTPLTWDEARQNALDRGGFLATVTSSAENTFINGLVNSTLIGNGQLDVAAWLGGSDRDAEGVWRWVDGPEAGLQFWQGSNKSGSATAPNNYANWSVGEPNDGLFTGPSEDYLAMWTLGNEWNDFSGIALTGGQLRLASVVEYVPAPSTAALALLGLAGLGATRRRKQIVATR